MIEFTLSADKLHGFREKRPVNSTSGIKSGARYPKSFLRTALVHPLNLI